MNSLTARLKGYTKFQIVHNLGTLEEPKPEVINYSRLGPAMSMLRSLYIARREVALYGYNRHDKQWINLCYSHTKENQNELHISREPLHTPDTISNGPEISRGGERPRLASEAAQMDILPYRPLP